MLEPIFENGVITIGSLFIAWGVALICGIAVTVAYRIKNRNYSKNLIVSLILFPLITQTVVMLVNRAGENDMATFGVGVAIAGVFGLVRFRSIQGNSREISCVFLAMAIGIALGVGYVWFALIFTAVAGTVFVGFKLLPFKGEIKESELKITVPEDAEFEIEFEKIIKKHTAVMRLTSVKTVKMGSLFEVTYRITLKDENKRKPLIDELRVINGNLPIFYHNIILEERDGL
ncbi:MAG: DUF4956 domain-containing protein [Firmicutes bacterium]|nr:DUF4956 domain-containing protein [Bacillota bacterium]